MTGSTKVKMYPYLVVDSYQEMSKSVPVRVTSLKTGPNEPEIHVMLFDMEALICHLLVEETRTQKRKLLNL